MPFWVIPLVDMAQNVAYVAMFPLSVRIALLGHRLAMGQLRGRDKS